MRASSCARHLSSKQRVNKSLIQQTPLGTPRVCTGRNASLTVLEVDEATDPFQDSFSSAARSGGPFRLGSEFSGADGRRVA